ncbi:MAG: hypothetical protein CVU63_11365 [Deltaproteobacteria bacterium HGW-Deltaproteobacteria-20]|nr:MAG: hypothetical protein CVU63_11365 [Deltaproteobacteria bacterium HGW-Deltaproteobacteria-20]
MASGCHRGPIDVLPTLIGALPTPHRRALNPLPVCSEALAGVPWIPLDALRIPIDACSEGFDGRREGR